MKRILIFLMFSKALISQAHEGPPVNHGYRKTKCYFQVRYDDYIPQLYSVSDASGKRSLTLRKGEFPLDLVERAVDLGICYLDQNTVCSREYAVQGPSKRCSPQYIPIITFYLNQERVYFVEEQHVCKEPYIEGTKTELRGAKYYREEADRIEARIRNLCPHFENRE